MFLLRTRAGLQDVLLSELRCLGIQGTFVEKWRSVEVNGDVPFDLLTHCRTTDGIFFRAHPPSICRTLDAFRELRKTHMETMHNLWMCGPPDRRRKCEPPFRAYSINSALWDVKELEAMEITSKANDGLGNSSALCGEDQSIAPPQTKAERDCHEGLESADSMPFHTSSLLQPGEWSPYGTHICAQIVDDEVSLEITLSGRLIPRPFIFTHNFSDHPHAPHAPIPTPIRGQKAKDIVDVWDIAPKKVNKKALAGEDEKRGNLMMASEEEDRLKSREIKDDVSVGIKKEYHAKKRTRTRDMSVDALSAIIYHEWDFSRDLSPVTAAICARHALWTHRKELNNHHPHQRHSNVIHQDTTNYNNNPWLVWDPFCGNGTVMLEVLALALGLPVASAQHPFPIRQWSAPSSSRIEEDNTGMSVPFICDRQQGLLIDRGAATREQEGPRLRILASTSVREDYRRALRNLHRFCAYYGIRPSIERGTAPSVGMGCAGENNDGMGRGPGVWMIEGVEVHLVMSTFEMLGDYVEGATILTRAPRPPSMRIKALETIKRFEQFGSFLQARSANLDHCWVLSEVPKDFKSATKVPWKEELTFRDHMRRKVSFLRFLGPRTRSDPHHRFDPDDV